MKEFFEEWNPSAGSKILLSYITNILEEYERQGYVLTLRQLYYQLVSKDLIPNTVKQYHKIGNIVSKGRLAGFIDWAMIEDRGRSVKENAHWDSPSEILRVAAKGYYKNRWISQDNYVEVWCEKDAISNILQPICSKWDVPFMANKGYSSQSALYEASQRFNKASLDGKYTHIIYLGDHDPSGIDMVRDVTDRMNLFTDISSIGINVEKIALTMEQIEEYKPPENPAKSTDSRFAQYYALYGASSWELDALKPKQLESTVTNCITNLIDFEMFDVVVQEEKEESALLQDVAARWDNE